MHLTGRGFRESAAPPMLSLRHATVLRGGRPALDDLSFEILEGEHTAILGPNGSGKSSLIRLVTRQDYPLLLRHLWLTPR